MTEKKQAAAYLSWPLPDLANIEDRMAALIYWQKGRCAVCGLDVPNEPLFKDHDHRTGLVRGFLCRRCNFAEGFGEHPIFDLVEYRARPPTVLFGIKVMYESIFGESPITDVRHTREEMREASEKLFAYRASQASKVKSK